MMRGPLGLTLQTPEAFSTNDLHELADDVEAMHNVSLPNNKTYSGQAHWMMIDIVNVVRDEIRKREESST